MKPTVSVRNQAVQPRSGDIGRSSKSLSPLRGLDRRVEFFRGLHPRLRAAAASAARFFSESRALAEIAATNQLADLGRDRGPRQCLLKCGRLSHQRAFPWCCTNHRLSAAYPPASQGDHDQAAECRAGHHERARLGNRHCEHRSVSIRRHIATEKAACGAIKRRTQQRERRRWLSGRAGHFKLRQHFEVRAIEANRKHRAVQTIPEKSRAIEPRVRFNQFAGR